MENKQDIGKLIYEETEKRLRKMEDESYVFPVKANKKDVIGIISIIFVCLVLIGLCVMGVVK